MTALLAMVRANFKMSLRNRAALFWNLAFPALFIVIFGVVFGRGESVHFDVGVTGAESAYRDRVVQAMSDSPTFTVTQGSQDDELRELATGSRGVVAVFADSGAADQLPAVTIYYNATQGPVSQVAVGVMRQVLTGAAGGTPPLQITEQAVTGDDVSFMDVFAPGILATGFVTYREKGILRRIRVTPFPLTSFLLARVISQLLIALMQAVILLGMAWALFGLHLRGNLVVTLVTILVGALAFLAIGFAISGIAPNTETAASYANLVTFPMLFLSGIFFSMENAPAWLQPITKVLPLPYLANALRDAITFGGGFGDIWQDLVILLVFFVLAMAVAVRFFRWDTKPA